MSDKRFVALLVLGALVVLGAIVLGVRPAAPPIRAFGGLKAFPASPHVTGTYPKECTLGSSNGHPVPDRSCTPGSVAAGASALCTTATEPAAPPSQELFSTMDAAQTAYGVRVSNGGAISLDHLVPLDLGGSNDISNLWPLPSKEDDRAGREKAAVDATLNKAVCAGTIGLGAAQNALSINWTTATQVLGIGG